MKKVIVTIFLGIEFISLVIFCGFFLIYSEIFRWCIVVLITILFVIAWLIYKCFKDMDNHEKEVINYLNKCDEKLKNGEMTQEENTDIHFYWECEHNFIC